MKNQLVEIDSHTGRKLKSISKRYNRSYKDILRDAVTILENDLQDMRHQKNLKREWEQIKEN